MKELTAQQVEETYNTAEEYASFLSSLTSFNGKFKYLIAKYNIYDKRLELRDINAFERVPFVDYPMFNNIMEMTDITPKAVLLFRLYTYSDRYEIDTLLSVSYINTIAL